MPKKALASLNVVINAVTSPLFRGLKIASKRLVAFGTKMKAIGRSISMSFTLPFAMVGVAGAKMAIDFEKNMTKINTLVGISAKEVNEFSKDVLKLGGETAQAPAELADGLFFLTSAGLRGANALSTLEAVSKAVAIGLGEQTDLAKVAAAAQNAYGEENITAAQALDVFGTAVQQGMFEASDLAEVLGTQLGLSSALGVSFQETNAFIATYTKVTGDAKAASTSFGGVMMALAKTTPQMERALKQVGMTGDSVRESLGEKGLRATLIDIKTAFEDNDVPLTQFFSKSQALKGVLGVLGNQTETYGEVLESMGGSAGFVADGFDTLSKTTGFKMSKAFNTLKISAMELGAVLMPVFTAIVKGVTKIGKAFSSLDGGTKKLVVGAAALLAFSGPLMTLAGGIVTAIGMILSPVGLVVAAIGALFYVIYNNWGEAKKIFVDFINYWIDLYNESQAFKILVESIKVVFLSLWSTVKFFFVQSYTILKNFGKQFLDIFGGIGDMIEGVFKGSWKQVKAGADRMGEALDGVFKNDESKKNVENYVAEIKGHLDQAAKNIKSKTKIELITEEDIQNGVDNVAGWLTDKLQKVKDKMKGFLGGSVLAVPDGGGDPAPASGGGGGTKELEKTLAKKKTLIQSYLEWSKEGYEGFADKVSDTWNKISAVAGAALNGIGNLMSAQHEKAMTEITNKETAEQGSLDKEFERNALRIENSKMSQEQKDAALNQLKAKFDGKQAILDEKFDAKKKALALKQAKRDKAMKIASAIMGTAQAIVNALAQGGPIAGPILAGLMAGLGAAQIATIASTPLPMADGGIAFGPTNALVGEYPGAKNDPEVVAPLSKLKGMLGNSMAQNVQLNVGGVLKGEDIFLANDNTDNQRERYI
jgi:TP901 family phage tail tape measure protein